MFARRIHALSGLVDGKLHSCGAVNLADEGQKAATPVIEHCLRGCYEDVAQFDCALYTGR